ncbi:formate dehydrogenase accessory sulfurtransferase FdhD [Azospirillum sp. ST 5-10]|uniref:formate dehydrogenase accessory sulfurtransferase FdhD n=1 Tax=unclassified Azospirillum TaxID=2630922 RepID=UPI003F49DC89
MDCVVCGTGPGSVSTDGARSVPALLVTADETLGREDSVVEEVPVALEYGRTTFAVMLATPTDLEDFAVGFSLTEGIAGTADEVAVDGVERLREGVRVRMSLPVDRLARALQRRRNMAGGSGCGRCGTDSFAETLRPLSPLCSDRRFAADAIRTAMAALPARQSLNRRVGGVHAAGFATPDGRLVAVREDVGRHNALDKLIGHLARAGIDPAAGFVVLSSRCSFELVHKTAAAGIPLVATVSAPTALAIDVARSLQLCVASFVRDGRFTLYSMPSRVL